MKEASPRTIELRDYQPPHFFIDTVDLEFDLHEQGTRVIGRLGVRRNPEAGSGALRLDGDPALVRVECEGAMRPGEA